jgi:hypothetical protein
MITCEYLLNSISDKPLNEEERNAIECYRAELAKALGGSSTTNGARNGSHVIVNR